MHHCKPPPTSKYECNIKDHTRKTLTSKWNLRINITTNTFIRLCLIQTHTDYTQSNKIRHDVIIEYVSNVVIAKPYYTYIDIYK